MKIAVLLPNWLGDLTMATPALRAMRRHFGPQARLLGVSPYLADVLLGTGWLDEQSFFDPRATDSALHSRAVARRMRAERFDMAVLFPNSLRTALVAWFGRATERHRLRSLWPRTVVDGQALSHRAGNQLVPLPIVESYLELARAIGCGEESPRLGLATVEADERSADGVFQRLGLTAAGRVVAMNSAGLMERQNSGRWNILVASPSRCG